MSYIGGYVMKPSRRSRVHLAVTRAKAKMYEYHVPEEDHINIDFPLTDLLDLTIGILGDISADYEFIKIEEEKSRLLFSAKYFDAILNSKSADDFADYLKLLGACAYYLSGFPGSAKVLIKDIDKLDLESSGIENLILTVLKKKIVNVKDLYANTLYEEAISFLYMNLAIYFESGEGSKKIKDMALKIKNIAHKVGSSRELLLADLLTAIVMMYLKNSVWNSLPNLSGIEISKWKNYLTTDNAIKELWPAQLLIGEKGIFLGKSGVIQMPTSAGKTKSSELIIRSSFLSGRCNFAVIVAPFRALCQEIYNDMNYQFKQDNDVKVSLASDVMQLDIERDAEVAYNILILTPEKLDYILRHDNSLASEIGLIIYDEGHLFDDSSRGVKYELLLASLKSRLDENSQVVLISAVMPNAKEIGKWLIGDEFVPVEASHLIPTNRSIAFSSWLQNTGSLRFVNEENIEMDEFFVPKILERHELQLRGQERKKRFYPENKPSHIAGSLACRLSQSGTVAIFTGRKDSAVKISQELVDAFDRGAKLTNPYTQADSEEMQRLITYIGKTLGEESVQYNAAKLGILIHHGSTPHGLRLAIEHALQNEHVKVVVCTSTLAQGVNLPIRYLIVTTARQGSEEIKVRDFHNLIGRAGRAGKYTEGTIIFSNTDIYDKKSDWYSNWRWNKVKMLLNPEYSEACRSAILKLLEPEPVVEEEVTQWEKIKEGILENINTYLLDSLSELEDNIEIEDFTTQLVKNTLAYHQAKEEEKKILISNFIQYAKDIINKEPVKENRKLYAKSIFSLEKSKRIVAFLNDNAADLIEPNNTENLLEILWPIIYDFNTNFKTSISSELLLEACKKWIRGESFVNIFNFLSDQKFGNRNATIDHIVDLCENGFGFDGSLTIGVCLDLKDLVEVWEHENVDEISLLQKMMKYGLPNPLSIKIYTLGFTDRNLAMQIADTINEVVTLPTNRKSIVSGLKAKKKEIVILLNDYPSYFHYKFYDIIGSKHRKY